MDFNWDAVKDIVVIGYTVWKWRKERKENDEKIKERIENPQSKQELSKRSEK